MIESERVPRRPILVAVATVIALCVRGPAATAGSTQDPEGPPQEEHAAKRKSFANPELLVTTGWLAEHTAVADLRIVDARDAGDYRRGHLPGAVSIPRPSTFDPEGPRSRVGPPELIAELFGSQGIDEKVHVVIYDEGLSHAAARVFWTLEHYGHPQVSVLDGGIVKWRAEGRPTSKEVPAFEPVVFTVKAAPQTLSTKAELLEDVGDAEVVMLDARSSREYFNGRIPGAVHIEWTQNFTGGDAPVFKSPKELTELYESAGVTREHRVHAY